MDFGVYVTQTQASNRETSNLLVPSMDIIESGPAEQQDLILRKDNILRNPQARGMNNQELDDLL